MLYEEDTNVFIAIGCAQSVDEKKKGDIIGIFVKIYK